MIDNDIRERYMHDPHTHALVDHMMSMLVDGQLTARDLAGSAQLAAQMYAERYRAPVMIRIAEGSSLPGTVDHAGRGATMTPGLAPEGWCPCGGMVSSSGDPLKYECHNCEEQHDPAVGSFTALAADPC